MAKRFVVPMPRRDRYKQPEGLIGVLLKTDAEFGDRDDAALGLGEFDEPEAKEALLTVAEDPATDPVLAEPCAESPGEIWARGDTLNVSNLRRLTGEPLAAVLRQVEAARPPWRKQIEAIRAQTAL
jgi:hypothetical protein